MKKMVMFFVVMMLVMPAFVLAAPVPDTGQTKSYKDDGTETIKKPPSNCTTTDNLGNLIGCVRAYSVSVEEGGPTYKNFFNSEGTSVYYFWKRRCYNDDGTKGDCPERACYTKASNGETMDCPTICYNIANAETRIEIPCPPDDATDGTGDDDFYGQDANYTINEPSYTTPFDGNDKLIKDERTGLIWLMKEDLDPGHKDSQPNNKNNKYTWSEANGTFIDQLNSFGGYEGYEGWRLPTLKELALIVHCDEEAPAIDGDFDHVQSDQYWSATPGSGESPTQAYSVNFDDGSVSLADITEDEAGEKYVIAVLRQDESMQAGKFVANETITDTITDTTTGLMWRKVSHTQEDWEGALLSCEALVFADFDDWRLPSRAELLSIVDYDAAEGALIDSKFADFKSDHSYWTSTSYVKSEVPAPDPPVGKAWAIDFTDGTLVGLDKKTNGDLYVLAVRGGQNTKGAAFVISHPEPTSTWKTGRLLPVILNLKQTGATISISRDAGKTYEEIEVKRPEGDASLLWTVTKPASDNCMVKVTSTAGKIVEQGLFSIEVDTGGDPKWDVNANGYVDLADIICGLKMLTGGTCTGE